MAEHGNGSISGMEYQEVESVEELNKLIPPEVRAQVEKGIVFSQTSNDGKYAIEVKRQDEPFKSDHYYGKIVVKHVPSDTVVLDEVVGLSFPGLEQMRDAVLEWFRLADEAIDRFESDRVDVRSGEDRP